MFLCLQRSLLLPVNKVDGGSSENADFHLLENESVFSNVRWRVDVSEYLCDWGFKERNRSQSQKTYVFKSRADQVERCSHLLKEKSDI